MDGPRLVQLEPAPQREVALDCDVFTIGRQSSCQIVLRGEEVSRQHARIVRALGLFWLEDLGSTNGTYYALGDEFELRLGIHETHLLLEGGVIRVGPGRLQARGLPATRAEALQLVRAGLAQLKDLSAALAGLPDEERDRVACMLREYLTRLAAESGEDDLHFAAAEIVEEFGQTLRGIPSAAMPEEEEEKPLPELSDDLSAPRAQGVPTIMNTFFPRLGGCLDADGEEGKK